MNDRLKSLELENHTPRHHPAGNGDALHLEAGQIWFNKTRAHRTATIISETISHNEPLKVQFKNAATGMVRDGELSLDRLLGDYTLTPLGYTAL